MAIDGFDPGRNGCGHVDCEMSSACKRCKMQREHYFWNHMRDDQRQFIFRASGDFKDSLHIPREVGSHLRSMISETMNLEAPNGIFPIEVCREMGVLVLRSGWDEFVKSHHIEENYRFLFTYRGNSTFKVHIFNPAGLEKPSFCSQPPSQIFEGVPHGAPCDPHVLNEQVQLDPAHVQTSTDFGYTTLPGCRLTKAQDEKVLDIARTMRSEMPLYVTTMNKSNVHLKDCSVNMPLKLLDHFQEDISKATVQLEDSDCNLYSVEASKHTDDQIVLQSGWYDFVVFHSIREKDLLIFRSKGRTRLQVLIIGPGSHQRTSSPHAVYSANISDDEHIVGEDTKKSSKWQKQVPDRCVKTQKVASTSSLSAKPGYEAHQLNGGASVELGVDSEPLSSNWKFSSMKILLEHHADPNKVSWEYGTPLTATLYATPDRMDEPTCLKCVKLLVEAGADVKCTNPETPLAIATTNGLTECAEYLLEVATNVNVPVKQDTDVKTSEHPRKARLKSNGAKAVQENDYAAALKFYTEAIKLDPEDAVLYSNRSLCHLKCDEAYDALHDANACIRLKPDWNKGYYRKGAALMSLLEYKEASDAFLAGVKLKPENKEMEDAYWEAVEAMRKEQSEPSLYDVD